MSSGRGGTSVRTANERSAVPRHMALILDGNRRWATVHGRTASEGHEAGFSRVPEVLHWCHDLGVETVTLWLLSTDNLRRDPAEVDALMRIITDLVNGLAASDRWRLRHRGVRAMVPEPLLTALDEVTARTTDNTGMRVNLAICYGGREEVTEACRELLEGYAHEGLSPAEAARLVTAETVTEAIAADDPAPELVVRTSGEQRSSGFLLWTARHAEHYFTTTYWPDFGYDDLKAALTHYERRSRGRLRAIPDSRAT
ncbi:UDP diphosphate synthase [Streptomyces sp. Tue 6075]|nr:UDP diphosphate synthase [Streptomyces sp. Tue 6075]